MKTIASITLLIFSIGVFGQRTVGDQQSLEKRGGFLFSNTQYDHFSFNLTPSSIFFNAYQFDLSYRPKTSRSAFSLSIANANHDLFDYGNYYYDGYGSSEISIDGWIFNLHHKYYLETQYKSNTAYYFSHGPNFSSIQGLVSTYEDVYIEDENRIEYRYTEKNFELMRIGYNLLLGFEIMMNERFFFDLNFGLGLRFVVQDKNLDSHALNTMSRNVFRPGYEGLTPIINTRFGVYIF
ncbi:MAG: hypothetical protein JJU02_03290 [Cryomorphaceae bacterium]|nr:hypothetical protein [Cryomorphaceae bacterium]